MFSPFAPKISLVVKSKQNLTLDQFISMCKENYVLTTMNISTCSISEVEPFTKVFTTIEIENTTKDFVLSNIIWNRHFNIHDEICWSQLLFNHRLKKMSSFMYNYIEPMFIADMNDTYVFVLTNHINTSSSIRVKCPPYTKISQNCYSKFKHNPQLLEFTLENATDDCFDLMNFLVRHTNISKDWNTLLKYVRTDDFLVITDESFEFNVRPYICISPNQITVHLPKFIIWSNDVTIVNSEIEKEFGFIPEILYKAIKYDHIIIIFKPFKSNVDDTYAQNMIRLFHRLNFN